mgnify:CR=1 FL=1
MPIAGIDHVHAAANDLDASIAFYTQVLGFRFLRRVAFGPDDARRELAYVGLGDMLLELVPPVEPPASGTAERPFALQVEDMPATIADLKAKGVAVDVEPRPGFSFGGLTAVIRDPSGLAIELREWAGDDAHNPDWQPQRADVVRTG